MIDLRSALALAIATAAALPAALAAQLPDSEKAAARTIIERNQGLDQRTHQLVPSTCDIGFPQSLNEFSGTRLRPSSRTQRRTYRVAGRGRIPKSRHGKLCRRP